MKATYENNFKKIKKNLYSTKQTAYENSYTFPSPSLTLVHEHCNYSLLPWTEGYASPLNHISLFSITSPSQLTMYHFVLVRDGALTLVDFFNRFPSPVGFKNLFIVHKNLKSLIPDKWCKLILFYDFDLIRLPYKNKSPADILLAKGLIMEGAFDILEFKKSMLKILSLKKFKKIIFCAPIRQNLFLKKEWNGDATYAHYSNEVMKFLYSEVAPKVEIEFITWKDFYNLADTHLLHFFDLNNKTNLYIDDFTNYYFLKKGATPLFYLEKRKTHKDDLVIKLSHQHGIRIFSKTDAFEFKKIKEIKNILKLLESNEEEPISESGFQALEALCKNNIEPFGFSSL